MLVQAGDVIEWRFAGDKGKKWKCQGIVTQVIPDPTTGYATAALFVVAQHGNIKVKLAEPKK